MSPRPLLLSVSLALALTAPAQTRLLRFPDLHGDTLVFVYAGDLWRAPAAGGLAVRLTSHPGEELFPRFSPDGQWIAFTGQVDGDEQVYVIPATGGAPRQLTFYPALGPLPSRWGYDNQVLDWTPDGKSILFRSHRDTWAQPQSRVYTVQREGGVPVPLPMPFAGATCFSPNGKEVVYSPLWRDFRSWKRYQGGWAQDLWRFDLASGSQQNLTNHPRTDRDPMWVGDSVFFVSDRDGTLNLWRHDLAGAAATQVTHSKEWDVRWPGLANDGRIVFELGGELWIMAADQSGSHKVEITVPTDDLARRPVRVNAAGAIEAQGLAPHGERAVLVARGDVFTVPSEHGPTRNLTRTPGAHERWSTWSPDGRWIAYASDQTGEEQVWVVAQDGAGEPRQITKDLRGRLSPLDWSPDSTRIAFGDQEGVLRVVEVASGELTVVAKNPRGQIQAHAWSPCSHWLAFTLGEDNQLQSIWLWSRTERQPVRVSDPMNLDASPVFDPNGERLYFLGLREFAPRVSQLEFNYAVDRGWGVFALALRKDLPALFPPRSDEVKLDEKKAEAADAQSRPAASKPGESPASGPGSQPGSAPGSQPGTRPPIRIDLEGIAQRVERVPVDFDNLAGLDVVDGGLLWLKSPAFYYGRESDTKPAAVLYDLKKREAKTLDNVSGCSVSADLKKLLIVVDGVRYVMDAKHEAFAGKKALPTADLVVDRVAALEWPQIFDEVWRRFRDFFYAPNLHGHDWDELRARYRTLLPHVAHRSDLNYVISEMIAELNAGHAYIAGGEWHRTERPSVALPGARFELDAASGRFRIARIMRGDNSVPKYRSPLTEVGVDARVGDWVLAIDGEELRWPDNPYRLLRHKGKHPVELTLNTRPERDGARTVRYQPIASERNLTYFEWVTANREKVDRMSGGKVGYIHLPDMGENGIFEWIRTFYPQVRKLGLVIDDRWNGGGNVSQMIIERLRRELMMVTYGRTTGTGTNPSVVFHGHLVCLLNENSASDGDIFPATFRRSKLGPLVGKRSWGGIIGITDRGRLIDGGTVNVPEFANTEPVGEWTIEGIGVQPDVEVENDPKSLLAGRDPQLEKGVELVLEAIARNPKALPARPADPIRK